MMFGRDGGRRFASSKKCEAKKISNTVWEKAWRQLPELILPKCHVVSQVPAEAMRGLDEVMKLQRAFFAPWHRKPERLAMFSLSFVVRVDDILNENEIAKDMIILIDCTLSHLHFSSKSRKGSAHR